MNPIRQFSLVIVSVALAFGSVMSAQEFDAKLFQDFSWRMIGPFRGGRTVAISGVTGRQNVFYMAPNNGGVWKSTDFGRTWNPIFDEQPTGSIGALAIAPSNPEIIYAGSGEDITGSISDCAMGSRSALFLSIRTIPIECSWRWWDILMARMRREAFSARSMVD